MIIDGLEAIVFLAFIDSSRVYVVDKSKIKQQSM